MIEIGTSIGEIARDHLDVETLEMRGRGAGRLPVARRSDPAGTVGRVRGWRAGEQGPNRRLTAINPHRAGHVPAFLCLTTVFRLVDWWMDKRKMYQ